MCKKLIFLVSLVFVLGLVWTSPAEAAIPDLVGWWKLDEGSGTTAADSSGRDMHGVLGNDPVWRDDGVHERCLFFDGDLAHVRITHHDSLNPGAGNFTFAFWANIEVARGTNGSTVWDLAVNKRDAGSNGYYIGANRDQGNADEAGFKFMLGDTAANRVDTPYLLVPLAEWVFVTCVLDRDADTHKISVDGGQTWASATPPSGPIAPAQDLGIGWDIGINNYWFHGKIDDVALFSRALTPEEVLAVYTLGPLALDPTKASKPNLDDGATDVLRDVVLSWTPGEFAAPTNGHKVYFGESFNDVNDGIGGITLSASSYDPGRLDFETTYYWRVDEVNGAPDFAVHQGFVWSFTIEPFAITIPGENITATASSSNSEVEDSNNTINGSGLDGNLHSTVLTDMWLTATGEPVPAWIQYDFDKVYKLHEMLVWNYNGQSFLTAVGLKDVVVEYSSDGTNWVQIDSVNEFAQATGLDSYAPNTTVAFDGIPVMSVRIYANSNWSGGFSDQVGLSEVQFLQVPVTAREPSPDDGATDVAVDVTLSFRAGREAAKHDVYLGTDEQAVIDGTIPVATVPEPSYDSSLDLAITYYWRIDEANDAETPTTWQGNVWDFTTQEFIVVDDFESYNDIETGESGSNLVYGAWKDGFDNLDPAENGSTMGYTEMFQPTMESGIVHGGQQSAPMQYDNTVAALSEVTRTLAPQDWTKHGVQTLTLWFRGAAGNTGQLYVKVNGSKVVYDGDASDMQRGWQSWNIELALFGVDLQSVTTLAIGVEGLGATGTLLLDDVRLYPYGRQFITPAEPDNAALVGHWKLDGDTLDYSGLGNDGTANGAPTYAVGKLNQAMSFDGIDDYVAIDGVADDITSNDITLTAWVNMPPEGVWYPVISCNTATGGNVGWLAVDAGGYADFGNLTGTMFVTDNNWHHLAYTRIGDIGTLYVDGVLEGTHTVGFNFSADNLWSIGQEWDGGPTASNFLVGTVDDVRIYDYGLSYGEVAGLAGRTQPFDKPF